MTEPAARLSLLTLCVEDLARSTAFYEALGFRRRARKYSGVAFFESGSLILSLWNAEGLAEDAGLALDPPSRFRGLSLAWNCTSRDEVDAAMQRAVAAGGTLVRSPKVVFWGGYTGYFTDPDGHLWEVAHNPDFPLSADGRLSLPD